MRLPAYAASLCCGRVKVIEPNPNIAAMAAYALPDIGAPGEAPLLILAQNEHPFPPSDNIRAAVNAALSQGNLYPDADWRELRAAIAAVHHLRQDQILCGAGSMELMLALVTAYLSAQDRILVTEYGYLFMRTLAQLVGAAIDSAAEKAYRVDIDSLLGAVRADTKLVFVVNPGNPCGSVIHNDEIRRLRDGLPDQVILLVDEAYAEFVDSDFHDPLFDLVDLGNTCVTRTFSKIYGLAGMRVGWGLFPAHIGDNMRKLLNPNNVSLLSQVAACAAMRDQTRAGEAARYIAGQRVGLSVALSNLGLSVIPSQTNFILVDFNTRDRAVSAFEYLRGCAILVRPMGGYGLPSCLRITIGLERQMQRTVDAFGQWKDQQNE